MSEYQFYEFKAIDKPLSKKEKEIVSSWSSRTEASNTGAVFEYHYSDFPQDELKVLEEYFDAMFYISNWGTKQLAFKLPNSLVDIKKLMHYSAEGIEIEQKEEFTILNFYTAEEEGGGWIEGDGYLSSLIPLRDDIIAGDYRSLYLLWLKISTEDVIHDWDNVAPESEETNVPANLKSLNGALLDFIDVFEIDKDAITVASEKSTETSTESNWNTFNVVESLSNDEKNDFLRRLFNNEPLLHIKLQKRLKIEKKQEPNLNTHRRRTIQEIVTATLAIKEKRKALEKQKKEEKRLAKIKKTEEKEGYLWSMVNTLIKEKKTKSYDEAVLILKDLKDLYEHKAHYPVYCQKIESIMQEFKRLTGLVGRIESAKLIK